MPFSCLESKFNVRCTDIVGMQVLGNLTVIGLVMLLGSCSLARFRQSELFLWLLVGSVARILLCV